MTQRNLRSSSEAVADRKIHRRRFLQLSGASR